MIKTEYQCRDCYRPGEIPHRFHHTQTWVCKKDAIVHLFDDNGCEVG